MDAFVADHGLLQANRLFGIYKRSDAPLLPTAPRTNKELEDAIGVSIFSERTLMQRGENLRKRFPALYNTAKRIYFKIR